jgi:hypothetical protein
MQHATRQCRGGLRGILPLIPFALRFPRVVASPVKVQSHRLAVELGFDFVFNVGGGHEDAAEIARNAAALATPHANRCRSPQCRYREALGAWRSYRSRAIGGSWPVHLVYLAASRLPVGRSVAPTMRRVGREGKLRLRFPPCETAIERAIAVAPHRLGKALIFFACPVSFRYFSSRSSLD